MPTRRPYSWRCVAALSCDSGRLPTSPRRWLGWPRKAEQRFAKLDKNEDGELTKDELKRGKKGKRGNKARKANR